MKLIYSCLKMNVTLTLTWNGRTVHIWLCFKIGRSSGPLGINAGFTRLCRNNWRGASQMGRHLRYFWFGAAHDHARSGFNIFICISLRTLQTWTSCRNRIIIIRHFVSYTALFHSLPLASLGLNQRLFVGERLGACGTSENGSLWLLESLDVAAGWLFL